MPVGKIFKPIDAREARLSTWWNRQDVFYAFRTWPEWMQRSMVLQHKSNLQRFQTFQFLTGNGLDPETSVDWIIAADAIPGELISGDYDAEAWRQMRYNVQQSLSGAFWKGEALVFDMKKGMVVKM